jgi:hypothetical protein
MTPLVLLALSAVAGDLEAPDRPHFAAAEAVEVHDMATTPAGRLLALAGRRARLRVVVDSPAFGDGSRHVVVAPVSPWR